MSFVCTDKLPHPRDPGVFFPDLLEAIAYFDIWEYCQCVGGKGGECKHCAAYREYVAGVKRMADGGSFDG